LKMNLELMRLIRRITITDINYPAQDKSRILPALRLSVAFLTILLCALSRNAIYVVMIIAAELAWLCVKPPAVIWNILKPVLLSSLFCMFVMLPAVFMGHPRTLMTVSLKVFESVLILSQLGSSISWKKMTDAFRTLHAPQLFVFTLDMTMRFLVILGRYSNAILEAVTLRRVGADHWKNAGTGGILGTTFLRAQQMSIETSEAMSCRCFDGEYRSYRKHKIGTPDMLYTLLIPLLVILFVYTQKAM